MSVVELLAIHRPLAHVLSRPAAVSRVARPSRLVLAFTAAIPVVLLAGWSAADALQPAGYSPVGETISVAAGEAGAYRWVATVALFAIGVGYVVSTVVLPGVGRVGRAGLLATGICGIGVAACPEAVSGPTAAHELWSVLGAVLLMLGPLLTLRRDRTGGWAQRPAAVAAFTTVFAALTVWLAYELNFGDAYGLAERLASNVEVCWPFLLALGLRSAYRGPFASESGTVQARVTALTPPIPR